MIVDDAELPAVSCGDDQLEVLLHALKHDLAPWLCSQAPQAGVATLADDIGFERCHAEREMPGFRQELLEKPQALGGLVRPDYLAAPAKCTQGSRIEGLDQVLDQHPLDATTAPTGGPAWLIDPVGGDPYGGSFSTPAAVAGHRHLAVPAGFVRGLPMGLPFVGRPFAE
ncbi:MAG: hypothetical protein C0505_08045 [Leptothrix sp. (in: Bacteria)]|nr:hypothetical protein [Leptothrix sp. (in: b-proteobacteria)]